MTGMFSPTNIHTRISNFQLSTSNGFSMYFWMTNDVALTETQGSLSLDLLLSLLLSSTSFSIVPSLISFISLIIFSNESNTWTPLPQLHVVGFNNHRFLPLIMLSYNLRLFANLFDCHTVSLMIFTDSS